MVQRNIESFQPRKLTIYQYLLILSLKIKFSQSPAELSSGIETTASSNGNRIEFLFLFPGFFKRFDPLEHFRHRFYEIDRDIIVNLTLLP